MKFKRLFHKNIKLTLEECQELMAKSSYGNLELHGRKDITELPDGLTVEGRLDIGDSSITKLPKNLTVKGSLEVYNTAIADVSEVSLIVDGFIRCYANSPLVNLAFEDYEVEIIEDY